MAGSDYGDGVDVDAGANNNTIGGLSAIGTVDGGPRNVISGNLGADVYISDSPDNVVLGNYLGSNAAGDAVRSIYNGVYLVASDGTTIGGTVQNSGNLISGNVSALVGTGFPAVYLVGSSNALIAGNIIGLAADGVTALTNDYGISVSGGSANTIGGTTSAAHNVVSGSRFSGISLYNNASANLVIGNFVGTDASGMLDRGNSFNGIILKNGASNNTIGGTDPGAGNLISGNDGDGAQLNGATTTDNLVQGNLIGTDISGISPIGNSGAGVNIISAPANTIGGPVAGARNVISGNVSGVVITGAVSGTVVAGNLIGTDASGTTAVGNLGAGVSIANSAAVTIGGTTTLARNVISANNADGIDVNSGSSSTLIEGNYVGVDQTGTQRLGNMKIGISVTGAPGTTIGGTAQGAGNVISANAQSGVSINGPTATATALEGNMIGTDKTGTKGLGNATFGVIVGNASGVTIGGTGAVLAISSRRTQGRESDWPRVPQRLGCRQPDRHRYHWLDSAGKWVGSVNHRRLGE